MYENTNLASEGVYSGTISPTRVAQKAGSSFGGGDKWAFLEGNASESFTGLAVVQRETFPEKKMHKKQLIAESTKIFICSESFIS